MRSVLRDQRALRVRLARLAHKGFKGFRVCKGLMALKVLRDRLGLLEQPAQWVHRALMATLVPMEQRARLALLVQQAQTAP